MYHPYFRGKQYELITVRELAPSLAASNFVPIIEPVKEALAGLEKTLQAVCAADGKAIVVVNPYHGVYAEAGENISALLKKSFSRQSGIDAGILLKKNMTARDILACCKEHEQHDLTLIHAGFTDAKGLSDLLADQASTMRHVFFEDDCGKLYRKHFAVGKRVLIRDGFEKRRNADHPAVELFSDLHVTYPDEGMNGFGDFLIVGDDYSESGGPAYAVAIHLTFIDPDKDDAMYIYHFVSERQDTPTDPAGKFGEALRVMMATLRMPNHHILETSAIGEFRELYERGHFPGLGYVKKLSMKHHIETLAEFFAQR